ncbi:LysM peptidoglycan-binding domain-containing protein [Aerococcus kribbianus]|uniref:LysM peptidoglycan-binding domain-containing protein n=1 Tax=Aerococcus kribbianus TaxID=2999064 RepID=A0A9X3FNJ7_9LACT|nr:MULTISPECIES: LysM peptidoglycan-binding domain-containing protein [unclassified Aerococcus]MCZ0716881.1 LysM peptidoglycan-binding domain-containing protein [Aerococcus sp. YH-aer221]MCZ0725169.1 LysM peptidoglycan-binding domain-containing protein [Aerococcus sp. YH-aer222]
MKTQINKKVKLLTASAGLMTVAALALSDVPVQAEDTVDTDQVTTITYKVQAGDSLYKIAQNYGVTVDQLKEWNDKTNDFLAINEKLVIKTAEPGDSNDQSEPEEKVTADNVEAIVFKTNEGAKDAARKFFNPKKHSLWQIVWVEDGYMVKFTPITAEEAGQDEEDNEDNSGNTVTTDQYYQNLDQAIAAAKKGYNNDKYSNWRVDWTKDGYVITYTLKKQDPPKKSEEDEKPEQVDSIYTVQAGDSYWKIAQKFGVSIEDLQAWNKTNDYNLAIGDKLIVKALQKEDEAPTDQNQEPKYYQNLNEAIAKAKAGFDTDKYSNWRVDWTEKGYQIHYTNK